MLGFGRAAGLLLLGGLTMPAAHVLAQAEPEAHDEPSVSSPRAGDSVYAALGVFLLGWGGRAGAYVTPDLGIDAEAQAAAMLFMGSSISGSLGVQYFLGETFYVRAAARV